MKNNEEVIFETIHWKAILMNQQLYLGRSVVVLKRPCGHLSGLHSEEILDFLELVKKLENIFKKTFNATMFNWCCLMNNAYQVTPPKPQVHWHFRPRYEKPVELDGQLFEDPNFGHHYLRDDTHEKMVSSEMLRVINTRLQENLSGDAPLEV